MFQVPHPDQRRAEKIVLEAFEQDVEISADQVADVMVDQDVSKGEYEGCSTELEMAYAEYERIAKEVLA